MKYTPGPWYWDSEGLGNESLIVFGRGFPAEMTSDANKALIAAAPDLLEALQLAEKAMAEGRNVTYPEWYGVINKARAAISKALGEE
ncbi:hypothetical protein ACVSXW_13840 [Salmonella enterica]|nr:hypothetical protein [Salmonella enterica subsp. enterica serovar Typhimurium]EDN4397402.1 hypothetical protein [Salmonella enterica subsp. enterica]EJH7801649.1 hypothetical protein [Salmonella enterica]EJI6221486.1 hypothetical protein [Salmonella enterica]HCB5075774.1 hypothetical protein [Salmonella enterica subsp. enterica serovar Typhimurium]